MSSITDSMMQIILAVLIDRAAPASIAAIHVDISGNHKAPRERPWTKAYAWAVMFLIVLCIVVVAVTALIIWCVVKERAITHQRRPEKDEEGVSERQPSGTSPLYVNRS